MNQKNHDYLQDQVKYLGFGDTLKDQLTTSIQDGLDKFSLQFPSETKDSKAVYTLNFSKSDKTDMYFFNSYDLQLENAKDQTLKHEFQVNGTKGVTAKEAINFLEGRSVKTEIDFRSKGKQEVFIALDQKEMPTAITADTKLPIRYFNNNYGIDTAKIIELSPLKLATEKYRDDAIKSLEKGNFVKANFSVEGKETAGLITLNAQYRSVDYYTENAEKIDFKKIDKNLGFENQKQGLQDHDANPLYSKDGNDFTDALIEDIENNQSSGLKR